ncbi:MAG: ABC transporter ATP-binding protein [Alphaproteobacteria bacterium]|nr:ABC transporter ATP-binding protein [Alphaproteobacteria bacterium]
MLEVAGLRKVYDVAGRTVAALDGVTLALPGGSFTAVVGRSGCGKTTLLRLLAGLEDPTGGAIRRSSDRGEPIGVVFQEPRLMPWLTVNDNVALGVAGRLEERAAAERVGSALALVGLGAFAAARPDQLSGGMAQRVAVARALAIGAEIVLMDEPFGALDAFTRRTLQRELVEIWRAKRPTILFVTHDVEEAALLAERVLVMEAGRLIDDVAVDRPHPRSPIDPALLAVRERVLAAVTGAPEPVLA